MQYLKDIKTQAELCRENNINANLFNKWLSQFNKDAVIIFEKNQEKEYQKKLEKLQNIIGKQTIEIDFLKRGLQNSIAESFFKTLKYNEVYLNEYESFEQAFSNICI